jgi:hypothetical protein
MGESGGTRRVLNGKCKEKDNLNDLSGQDRIVLKLIIRKCLGKEFVLIGTKTCSATF